MVNMADIMDLNLLDQHIQDGNVSATQNAAQDMTIFKYSKMAPIRACWDEVTLQTRGLIVDNQSQDIVARGFNKFFNYSELEARGITSVDVDAPGVIMPKMDGSLGICFYINGSWTVTTAGSFISEQAIHATELFNARYGDTEVVEGLSLLVEIIYPKNRIVTDYGKMDDLVLLGGMFTDGTYVSVNDISFSGPKVDVVRGTIREALAEVDPEDGTEGFIVRQDSGLMTKLKFPHYLMMHKARFSITPNNIMDVVESGTAMEYKALLPDEFYGEFDAIHDVISGWVADTWAEVSSWVGMIPDAPRKDQAGWVNQNVPAPMKSLVMSSGVAGKSIDSGVHRVVRNRVKKEM